MKQGKRVSEHEGPWRVFWRDRAARWSLGLLLLIGTLAILVPVLPLASPSEVKVKDRLLKPTVSEWWRSGFSIDQIHDPDFVTLRLLDFRVALFGDKMLGPLLGTDELGRCVLSRILWGARKSLSVGLVASLFSLMIGVGVGALAGYRGGRVDLLLMRLVDVIYALPLMFVVIFVVGLLRGLRKAQPDFAMDQTVALFLVIGAISWLNMARVVRAQVLSLRSQPFVEAALLSGVRPGTVIMRHILPNAFPAILVTLTLTVPRVILFEAFLSFLGLGVEAPDVSWGLLARQGSDALTAVHISWWMIVFPGGVLAATLLALNLLGDRIRDALDPHVRSKHGIRPARPPQ